jgi:ribonuclease E
MSQRMLIDARHPEETRVAVVNGNRIEEFDFEAADRKQLKGNIYLARVTRVEPSLQAAFVEYGGNRHGFLAFSEIHPDYYQIPREDREALLREEQALAHDDSHDDAEATGEETGEDGEEIAESGGHGDDTDALRRKRQALRRRYKIQEVIQRRQVLLIQVVKEERGNKGAALTTYLSLAGRYCVLMPNTAHGGGISRKISNLSDRKRLKQVMADLKLPNGMGAIVRTAGLKRSKTEIKRDFDYLTRLWDEIRETTLSSTAPCLVHQDSDLIKRAIRDVYGKDIEQVLVEGAEGYEAAHTFMKMLMPTHAAKVVQYTDPVPLFQRFGVEGQLEAMYQPVVQLRSGGYIVINPTEALVSIDINSGRSTREHNIEETAYKTNMEAAEEIGRQLRLRDMAGLVVIDFIDMEVSGNNRRVERAMKDALRHDRARIQLGRISSFGLMEMSRQRLRTGVLEASTHICPMCDGSGYVRAIPSAALAALRTLEAEALKGRASEFTLRASVEVAIYVLNRKRAELAELEQRYGIGIEVIPDGELMAPNFTLDAAGPPPAKQVVVSALPPVTVIVDEEDEPEIDDVEDDDDDARDRAEDDEEDRIEAETARAEGREPRPRESEGEPGGRRRRRRRRGGRRDATPAGDVATSETGEDGEAVAAAPTDAAPADGDGPRKRRRGRRGGRRGDAPVATEMAADIGEASDGVAPEAEVAAEAPAEKPKRRGRARKAAAPVDGAEVVEAVEVEAVVEVAAEAPAVKPARRRGGRSKAVEAVEPAVEAAVEVEVEAAEVMAEAAPAAKPARRRSAKSSAATAEPVVAGESAAAPADAAPEAPVAEVAAAEAAVPETVAADVAAADAADEPADAGPPRKGWWQRTFGD